MAERVLVCECPRCGERTPHARLQRSAAPAFGWLVAAVFAQSFGPTAVLYPVLIVIAPIHAALVIARNACAKVGCLRCAQKDAQARRANSFWRALRQGRVTVSSV